MKNHQFIKQIGALSVFALSSWSTAQTVDSVLFAQANIQPGATQTESSTGSGNSSFFKSDLSNKGFFSSGEWFFSWGYNKTTYSNSDINVSQPSLGNNFTVHDVQGHDEYVFPQCCSPDNLRIGRFIDEDKKFAVELSLDHTKYTSTEGQTALVTGANSGGVGNQQLTNQYFTYMLHNGLNHLMVDLVYRKSIFGELNATSNLAFIGKIGTGLAIVHPYNIINGNQNDEGQKEFRNYLGVNNGWWRIVGISTGVEVGVRYVVWKPVYLELTNKQIYTDMSNIPVYQGIASQKLWSHETVLSLGYTF
jgi:hypothetical protein